MFDTLNGSISESMVAGHIGKSVQPPISEVLYHKHPLQQSFH